MRVAIDLSPCDERLPGGVRRVFEGALAALAERRDVELIPLTPPPRARRGLARAAWRQLALPRAAERARADLLHSFVSAFPLSRRVPAVATVHELPWLAHESENAGRRHRGWVRCAVTRAAAVCTPSAAVRAHLAARGAHVAEVPWGLAPAFLQPSAERRPGPQGPPQRPYVLAVGAGRPKKRLALLLEAAAVVTPEPLQVLVTGPVDPVVRRAARAAERDGLVRFTGTLPDAALADLYRGARATAVLARSEGFGFPVLEALALGCAVVCPAGTAQSALAKDYALTFDGTTSGLAHALSAAPAPPIAARHYARSFTWERTAEALCSLWQSVLAGPSRTAAWRSA